MSQIPLLNAHARALSVIDALTQTPEVQSLLKPVKELTFKIVYHYQCPTCGLHFWTENRLDNIDCPVASCKTGWLPHTMDGAYERGAKERMEVR